MNSVISIELTVAEPFTGAGFEWAARFIVRDNDATIRYARDGNAETSSKAWQAGLEWINKYYTTVGVDTTTPSVG